jgi:hypothetical protein
MCEHRPHGAELVEWRAGIHVIVSMLTKLPFEFFARIHMTFITLS